MNLKTTMTLWILLGLCWPGCSRAAPRGVVLGPGELSAGARGQLKAQIQQARRRHPAAFEAVTSLRGQLPDLARQQRGRMLNVARPLRALGAPALMPMLHELVFYARPRGSLSEWAWRGWRASLLEAVGSLRDPRAAPALWAILASDEPDLSVLRGAATALGRLGDETTARQLVRLIRRQDSQRARALIPALGECRRASVARALAAMLREARGDTGRALALVQALGEVGNAWAWKTPAVARSGEGQATRRRAMEALVGAYPDLDSASRAAAVKSLALIGQGSTIDRVAAQQRKASGQRAEALAELSRALAATPLLR